MYTKVATIYVSIIPKTTDNSEAIAAPFVAQLGTNRWLKVILRATVTPVKKESDKFFLFTKRKGTAIVAIQ